MKKIPVLFERDKYTFKALPKINKKVAYALNDTKHKIMVTHKYDGTAVYFDKDKNPYCRRMIRGKEYPDTYIPLTYDEATDKTFGWIPIDRHYAYKKAFDEAVLNSREILPDHSYELVGPSVNGNREGFEKHCLKEHGGKIVEFPDIQSLFSQLVDINKVEDENLTKRGMVLFDAVLPHMKELHDKNIEGVVFWQNGKPFAKLRAKDFVFRRDK